jgi:hypothetical protein
MRASEFVTEEWSAKYKSSINCANPKGFSQRAHCAGRRKNEDLTEFAPGGDSSSSYYAITSNFVNEFAQQKQEELQDLIDAGWTKQDLAQAGTLQGQAADIAHFEQVRDGFLKGLKPGFDAYLQGDTQLKDQLGAYWMENDLPLTQDWEKIYGEPWGDDSEFNEGSLNEFAPSSDDNRENNPEDVLFRFAQMWYSAPDVATQRRVEQALAKIGWEIGELESEEGGAFVMRVGDEDGNSYLAWSEEQLADQLNELTFKGSPCTKDCSGHRAGYEWSQRKGGVDAASWSRSFNNGAALFKNGY